VDDDSYEDRKPSQLKRKSAEQEDDRAPKTKTQPIPAKRRKTEGESSAVPSRDDRSEFGRRVSMDPRREKANGTLPNSSKSTRTKEETSSSKRHSLSNEKILSGLPSSSNTRAAGPLGGKTTSTKKNPRRSPIYTSSEEGGEEEDAPLKTRVPTKPSNPPVASSSRRSRNATSRPLPTDHSALRARYDVSYLEYLSSFQRLVIQKGKIDRLLKSSDMESIGSLTDSEGDIELLDPEELSQLAIKHKRLEEELEAIQKIFRVTSPV
jgi:RNA polymerase II elongation factor ELL